MTKANFVEKMDILSISLYCHSVGKTIVICKQRAKQITICVQYSTQKVSTGNFLITTPKSFCRPKRRNSLFGSFEISHMYNHVIISFKTKNVKRIICAYVFKSNIGCRMPFFFFF